MFPGKTLSLMFVQSSLSLGKAADYFRCTAGDVIDECFCVGSTHEGFDGDAKH